MQVFLNISYDYTDLGACTKVIFVSITFQHLICDIYKCYVAFGLNISSLRFSTFYSGYVHAF